MTPTPTSASIAGAVRAQPKTMAVLISGGGSNLQALIDAQVSGALGNARISCVVSNREGAFGLQRAEQAGIAHQTVSLKAFCHNEVTPAKRVAFDAALAQQLNERGLDLIVLAGWMHIFSPAFLSAVNAPVINLHPALPGQFAGAHGIEDAYKAWQAGHINHTGCMVHEVIEEIDAGKVIATQTVPCWAGDTLDDLKARMHAAEHALIVRAVREYCGLMMAHPTGRTGRIERDGSFLNLHDSI